MNQAQAVIDALLAYDASLALVALAGSPLIEFARQQGVNVVSEAFADRAYHRDGRLVSRRQDGAVLHDTDQIAQRVLDMIQKGGVMSIEGVFTPIQADTVCLHGDTLGAVEIAKVIKQTLTQHQIQVRSFTDPMA